MVAAALLHYYIIWFIYLFTTFYWFPASHSAALLKKPVMQCISYPAWYSYPEKLRHAVWSSPSRNVNPIDPLASFRDFTLLLWPKLPSLYSYKLSLPEHHLTNPPQSSAGPCVFQISWGPTWPCEGQMCSPRFYSTQLFLCWSKASAHQHLCMNWCAWCQTWVQKLHVPKYGWGSLPWGTCWAEHPYGNWLSAWKSLRPKAPGC